MSIKSRVERLSINKLVGMSANFLNVKVLNGTRYTEIR